LSDTGVLGGGDAPGTVEARGASQGNPDGIADPTNDDARLSTVDVLLPTYKLNGVAQKGPFSNGTNITIAECDNSMAPTGRTFATSIVDNTGAFSLPNVQLSGKYVRLTADGFYFDEVANQLSVSRIALNALADVTTRSAVNVNLLTHLEQPRLEYLVGQGASFDSAKAQAQTEILGIFGFTLSTAATSESLDIARGTDDDAMLLAVSAILQGWRTPGELTELLSNIATDIKTDGVLTSRDSGSALMNGALMLNLAAVRSNLEHRYSQLGMLATIGNFEKYVQAFIRAAKYAATEVIAYPATGTYGPNFLDPSMTTFPAGAPANGISFRADLPRGASIKVALQGQGGVMWAYTMGRTSCWTMTTFDSATQTQTYSVASSASAQSCDLNFHLMSMGFSALPVDVGSSKPCVQVNYYENYEFAGATSPTATKQVCDETPVVTDAGVDAGSPVTLDGATKPQGTPDSGVTPDAASTPDAANTFDAANTPDAVSAWDGGSGFPRPTITSFGAADAKVTAGQGTTLSGTFANGTGILSPANSSEPSGFYWPTGPLLVPTTYTLTVTNPAGDFVTAQVTVDVEP
jgi:hypothetical protein